jgi:hypothetical protein
MEEDKEKTRNSGGKKQKQWSVWLAGGLEELELEPCFIGFLLASALAANRVRREKNKWMPSLVCFKFRA